MFLGNIKCSIRFPNLTFSINPFTFVSFCWKVKLLTLKKLKCIVKLGNVPPKKREKKRDWEKWVKWISINYSFSLFTWAHGIWTKEYSYTLKRSSEKRCFFLLSDTIAREEYFWKLQLSWGETIVVLPILAEL